MQDLSAVIGANFGDEGKGLMTDFLSHPDSLVVRFNGGAQAGHTVTEPGGRRHVFHHFGSGSFRGAATFLSRHFLVNPIMFMEEYKTLANFGLRPTVFVDPDAFVSTPWDMLLNQAVEAKRGEKKHGSCGLGIHETVVRSQVAPLRFSDLFEPRHLWARRLEQIRDVYVLERAHELGVSLGPVSTSQELLLHFMSDVTELLEHVCLKKWDRQFARQWRGIVFEGAQGLRLDEGSSYFPHVTCSKTGLSNVADLLEEAVLTLTPLNTFYCTRTYVTRHGAGPLKYDLPYSPYPKVKDLTNVPNPWQDSIRYGRFDVDEFSSFVRADWKAVSNRIKVTPRLALTCVDQLEDGNVDCILRGVTRMKPWQEFAELLMWDAGLTEEGYASFGPTRKTVRRITNTARESVSFA